MSSFYSFFAPAIVVYAGYEYMKKIGADLRFDELTKTKVVGTLLDLRDFEMASQWEIIATARRKAGCMPELGLTPKEWEAEKARQDKMGQDLALMYQRLCDHKALKTLVTISSHSAQSIRKNAQCSQPIQVLFAPEKNREKPEPFIWHGIDFQNDPYLIVLNAGRFEKNAAGAVAAFNKLCGQPEFINKHPNLKLVLVGINNFSDMGIKNPNLHGRILVLPHLSAAQLEYLLINACGLLYPSFNEGFGLPPVEAMSIGVPCVVSKCTSLPEVCGDAVLYCNPLDVDSIAAAINSLLNHKPNIQKLKAQAAAVKSRQNKDLAALSSLILGLSISFKLAESPTNKSDCNTKNLSPAIVCG
jgi:glycosyltransferase involved in cell wall biosynthesis